MEAFLSEVTEFGISIDVKPVAQNAKDSIVVTLFGIEIPVRFSVFWNAPCDIVVTPYGIENSPVAVGLEIYVVLSLL